jgi:hypothetical protein
MEAGKKDFWPEFWTIPRSPANFFTLFSNEPFMFKEKIQHLENLCNQKV